MPDIDIDAPGTTLLLMGNEAIARGALEAGIGFIASYPGTPSSEILPAIAGVAKRRGIYAEWSVNEMVALMNAAGASLTGIRAMASMKQNGTNVALDFIATLVMRSLRGGGGLVLVNCDDPGSRNSPNEQDTRPVAKWLDIPLLEPGNFQEAKDMTKWLFELSEELDTFCMLRCVAKISHTRGNVTLGEIPEKEKKAYFPLDIPGRFPNPHANLHRKLERAQELFETSPFNWYTGPEEADLLIITCGSCWLHSQEAVRLLGLKDRVGILKLGTLWPLPENFVRGHLGRAREILFFEETDPFLERSVMEFSASLPPDGPRPVFYGKRTGHVDAYGELNPDSAIRAISKIMGLTYEARDAEYSQKIEATAKSDIVIRLGTMCAGCPHRASYWAIKTALKLDGREGFATADNGCLSAGLGPGGFSVAKCAYAMGSGAAIADGLGKLGQFGFEQPVLGGVGDSTFYHAGIPALLNGVWNNSNFTLVVYDNSATAMTGFQPHPGTGSNALAEPAKKVSIEDICHSMGVRVEICDPFHLKDTVATLLDVMRDESHGPRVVIMRHECELIRARRESPPYRVFVDTEKCLSDACGCNRFCTRIFRCPGLVWDDKTGKAQIDEFICSGCGLCTEICPQGAIIKEPLLTEEIEVVQELA
jgi:indolepyruvate ferredoxin oxidoreductase alpha subunit